MNLTALVIDDSRVMRNMVMQALQKARLAEFTFLEAQDGADGLTKFDPKTIDICFVDWNMPNMTGVEFVKKARSTGGAFEVPMVMVTSERAVSKIEEALNAAGADAYICKPFTPEDMQVKLQKIMHKLETKKQPAAAAGGANGGGGFFSGLFN
ncbi:response regulator [Frigoriglobus tundricola]|uniref:Chemotaxis regulator-transmits chemoreceptor signals to flagelllar motor components CheY n=1 Tax=Frigoriglobus tundricola TaxID=2774151 RepID=A0A6M5YYP6_9BACT|nr:response regulator [Frigoriglobus tundricola]QJW98032.1 Chemotaxis regulator - transmits chemoreceptor signals to flagelllar motor components CheY [Frigoriglobus tundricola]